MVLEGELGLGTWRMNIIFLKKVENEDNMNRNEGLLVRRRTV